MPDQFDFRKMEQRSKWGLLIASLVTLIVLIAAAIQENFLADWYQYQQQYARILKEKATDARGLAIADQFAVHLNQNVVPQLGKTDRCITCHLGIDDPRMADQPQPFTAHPGQYLNIHDPSKFGCTVCHQGQGLATETADAHGQTDFWDYPMLEKEYAKTTCTRCHSNTDLYGQKALLTQADASPQPQSLILQGKQLAEEKGCFGCHAQNGRGGTLGPDLSQVGDKTRHQFDFSHLGKDEPREIETWLKKHFLKPEEISPGTAMPDLHLNETQAEALTAYMLSLRRPIVATEYRFVSFEERFAAGQNQSGKQLYLENCASCHGQDGRASDVPGIRTPALNNEDALAVAGDDFYQTIITRGRSGSSMPAWGPGKGNLSQEEIDRIVQHIRTWEPAGARIDDVYSGKGDVETGRHLYSGLCGNCHGRRGEGGIGNALNSLTFLAVASDRFLAETIINGRGGTAMAAWKHLSAQEVSDMLAYIRTWQPDTPAYRAVQSRIRTSRATVQTGQLIFNGNCATCHGPKGEGGIGPRLNTPDVLRVVDNRFLHRVITEGRPDTAMPAWRHLSADQVGALISYIRSWDTGTPIKLAQAPTTGDYALGEVHYQTACQSCHGENGIGGVGPRLAGREFLRSVSNDVLYHWISQGRSGTAMKGFLVDAQGPVKLTRNQIGDVMAYLRYQSTREDLPMLRVGTGDVHLGAQLFRGSCASCHGYEGEGASGPQLNNASFLTAASNGFLQATIAVGRSGTPMQSMVHGQQGLGQIAPDQIDDLIAYMRTWEQLGTRKQRMLAEMSPFAIATGQELFGQFCSGCHGPGGRGMTDGPAYFAPALNNREFLDAASDGFLQATIARGRSRTPMRPFGEGAGGIASLKSEQISQIVSYIRSWQTSYASK